MAIVGNLKWSMHPIENKLWWLNNGDDKNEPRLPHRLRWISNWFPSWFNRHRLWSISSHKFSRCIIDHEFLVNHLSNRLLLYDIIWWFTESTILSLICFIDVCNWYKHVILELNLEKDNSFSPLKHRLVGSSYSNDRSCVWREARNVL